MPVVSVIVPVYNVERYLARCLDSVLAACRRAEVPCEILCVNDGSTDASGAVLSDYAARIASGPDRTVALRVIEQANGGLSSARNAGLDAMRGEWTLFVDSDDWIPEDAIAGYLSVARASGADVVVSADFAYDRLSADGPRTFKWSLERPALARLVGRRKLQSSVCNKFFRASLFRAHRFLEGIYFEDWPLLTCLMAGVSGFALVREPMYVYCRNAGAESIVRSSFGERKAASYLKGIDAVCAFFRDRSDRALARRRCAFAVRMLVGKTAKAGGADLARLVARGLEAAFAADSVRRGELDWKTRFRLWRLERRAR